MLELNRPKIQMFENKMKMYQIHDFLLVYDQWFVHFDVKKKYKLPILSIFNFNGTLNEKAIDFNGKNYNNITIKQTREIVIELLKKNNFLEKIQIITTNIGFSERSNTIVEPMLSKQ